MSLDIAQAQPKDVIIATIDRPAAVAINRSGANYSPRNGAERLIVTFSAFTPSPDGPVQIVVLVRCKGGEELEVGRVGILPETAFSAADPSRAQHFGFALPEGPGCRHPETAIIRIEPSLDSGTGASITIARAVIE